MKKTKNKISVAISLAAMLMLYVSCVKEFLEIKRDKSQVIPETLEDYRAILDHHDMNVPFPYLLGELGSDDYFLSNDQWRIISAPAHKNAYIWADEIYQGEGGEDWNAAYQKVLYANFVLEGVGTIDETPFNKALRDELIGAAYFYRGASFFLLAQLFCKQYDAATAQDDLGLPLRVTSNINDKYKRATLEQTYIQIISDLEVAASLLPHRMSVNTRPWRPAALGMLAKAYLQKGDYRAARTHADLALSLAPDLLDYNEIKVELSPPFPQYGQGNSEIVFYSQMPYSSILQVSRLSVDGFLYDLYHEHDLRKQAFFNLVGERLTFKGHYTGLTAYMFSGLTTSELLLVRAECSARIGSIEGAVADLNTLLSRRFKPEHFEAISDDTTQSELLELVLTERRKELVFRGRRWHDLKRFAKDPNFAKPLNRVMGDVEYTLPLGSSKWVWPIPPDVIKLGAIKQNER